LGITNVQGESLQVKNFHLEGKFSANVKQPIKHIFDSYFDNWFGESWRELPSKSGDKIESLQVLFPGNSLGENFENLLSGIKKFQILPIRRKPSKTPHKIEF
jgi:hypothetical protein